MIRVVAAKPSTKTDPEPKKIRLILIEDHADFRESVSMVLTERGYDCVGEFSTMEDALEAIRYEPCLAVLAVLDGPSGLEAPGALHPTEGPIGWLADNQKPVV